MNCQNCNTETTGIQDGSHLWCTNCGSNIQHNPQFVTGYSQSHQCKSQIYSRRKRFRKYIQQVCPSVLQYKVLDLFSNIEFCWTKSPSRRIYFFAKPVMVQFCCNALGISGDLPCLKDKHRENDQLAELGSLLNGPVWKKYTGSLSLQKMPRRTTFELMQQDLENFPIPGLQTSLFSTSVQRLPNIEIPSADPPDIGLSIPLNVRRSPIEAPLAGGNRPELMGLQHSPIEAPLAGGDRPELMGLQHSPIEAPLAGGHPPPLDINPMPMHAKPARPHNATTHNTKAGSSSGPTFTLHAVAPGYFLIKAQKVTSGVKAQIRRMLKQAKGIVLVNNKRVKKKLALKEILHKLHNGTVEVRFK